MKTRRLRSRDPACLNCIAAKGLSLVKTNEIVAHTEKRIRAIYLFGKIVTSLQHSLKEGKGTPLGALFPDYSVCVLT